MNPIKTIIKTMNKQAVSHIPQAHQKIKTIVLSDDESIDYYHKYFNRLNIDQYLDYKIVTPEQYKTQPFGEHTNEVEILGVDWGMPELVNDLLDHNPNIKWVHGFYTGVEHFMTPELKEKSKAGRFELSNCKGAFSKQVAEFVLYAMMWFAKNGNKWTNDRINKKWEPVTLSLLAGKTVGIVGFGSVGCEIAKLLKNAFGMRVLIVKRDVSILSDLQMTLADEILCNNDEDIGHLLSESDYVINTLPFTPQTVDFWDLAKFKQMKSTAIFLNTGRGVSVVEQDLVAALRDKIIAGAYSDVQAVEPLPETSELWGFENMMITPHSCHSTDEKDDLMFQVFKDNIIGYLNAGNSVSGLKSRVNFEAGY